ncbi:MAG: hypothetical protein O8C66_13100 [Candidatus Methanoperedens sp.]|nr:hypothetical protein [Candidatus Methanoperedens sp.]MCZ7371434.1 hypothetical protein [Candidatus Methanoperedens sp.]
MTEKPESMYRRSLQLTARILKDTPRLLRDKSESKNKDVKPPVRTEPPAVQPPQQKKEITPPAIRAYSDRPAEIGKAVPIPILQSRDGDLYQKLSKEIIFSDTEKVVSIILDPSMILKVDLALLQILYGKGMKGIIICAGRPADSYIKLLRSTGLNPDSLVYIDTLTYSSKKKDDTQSTRPVLRQSFYYQEKQNIKLVPHPSDFTAIDVAFSQAVKELLADNEEERLFLLIDGIASHQLYVKPSALGAFIHILVSKARSCDIFTALLLSEGVDPILINTIKTFSDKIVSIK